MFFCLQDSNLKVLLFVVAEVKNEFGAQSLTPGWTSLSVHREIMLSNAGRWRVQTRRGLRDAKDVEPFSAFKCPPIFLKVMCF